MSRYRLCPTSAQEAALVEHCRHARFVWNLACEQQTWWRTGRGPAPSHLERCRQLTEARKACEWLRAGNQMVQQQALRDFAQGMSNFFNGTHRRPTWRKAGVHEGFRIVGERGEHWDVRRLSRKRGEVRIPKVGWVRFRWSRPVPAAKSYRVTCDRAGRWHVAFAAVPAPVSAPGNGQTVGVDRGVVVSAALSTGELLNVPGSTPGEAERLLRLQRRLFRAKRGSKRRAKVKAAVARLKAREADRRKNWVEQASTGLARRFDTIHVEALSVGSMTRSARGSIEQPGCNVSQKAGLNRGILANAWGMLVRRLTDKAPGRVVKVNPAHTSQTCSVCGAVDARTRESQAVFACRSCTYTGHADVNAAINILHRGGTVVAARGDLQAQAGSVNREPTGRVLPDAGISAVDGGEDVKKRALSIAASGLLAFGLAGCGSSSGTGHDDESATVSIMVGGLDKQIYLPAMLTKKLGYFTEQGLKVELSTEPAGVQAENAMIAGKVDAVVGFYDHTIDLQGKGKHAESVVQLLQVPGEVEVCRSDLKGKVRTPADWSKGTKLGVTGLGSSTNFLSQYLAVRNHVPLSDVTSVAVKAGNTFIAAMRHKSIDCGMTTEPTVSQVLNSGTAYPIVDMRTAEGARKALGGLYPASALYTRNDYVESHEKTVQKLANAFVKTMHWIHDHSAAQITAKMPAEYYKGSGKEAYIKALADEKGIYTPDGIMPEGGPETVLKVLKSFDPAVKGKDIDLSKTYTTKFAEKANSVL